MLKQKDAKDVITPAEAARIYKRITGRRRSPRIIAEDVHIFRHLALFEYRRSADPKLKGIYRSRWEYFVSTRLATRGHREIFSADGVDVDDEERKPSWALNMNQS